jgi:tetratricopeptide (TPR) repeat protein
MAEQEKKTALWSGPAGLLAFTSFVGLLSLTSLSACGPPSPPQAPSQAPSRASPSACAASPPFAELAEPERRRIEAFAAKIEASMNEGDASFLIDRIDPVAMSAPAMKGEGVTAAERDELAKRARAVSRAYGMGILRGMGQGGRYRLLHAGKLGGKPAAIFRTVSASGSFDYHGWIVEPRGEPGDFKLVDVHLFVLGQSMSSIIQALVSDKTGAPAASRCPRVSLLMKLREARDAGDEARAAAILDEVEKLPADDPARGSILLDRLVEKKRFAEAMSALLEMDRRVGGDPYLWALRGNILFMQGKTELAKTEIGRALTADPSLEEGYLALIGISLKERRWSDTARWLTTMRDVAGAEIVSLESLPEYAEFTRSPEYAVMKEKTARLAACNSLITVINAVITERDRRAMAVRRSMSDAEAYKTAAKASEEAALELSKVTLPYAELTSASAEFQDLLKKAASALTDAASALEAGDRPRAQQAILRWNAALEAEMVESAPINRVNRFCQQ